MMKKVTVKQLMLLSLFVAIAWSASAQMKVGDNPNTINKGSILELEAKDKGVLYPRVALTASNAWAPLQGTAVAGMTVYNTATVTATTSATTSLSPGFYFWEGAKWNKLATPTEIDNSAEWVTGDINSGTLTYMKEAMRQGDTIAYRKSRNFTVNLGKVTREDTKWVATTSGNGYAPGEAAFEFVASSDVLPLTSNVAYGANDDTPNFYFINNTSVVRENHVANAVPGKLNDYQGQENRVVIKDVTTPLNGGIATSGSYDLFSNATVNYIQGVNGITSAGSSDGTYKPTVTNNTGGRFRARNYGTSTNIGGVVAYASNDGTSTTMRGVVANVSNYGSADNLYGGIFYVNTQGKTASATTTAAHTVKIIRGIRNNVNIAENATISTNSVYGIENTVTAQATSSTQNILGGINRINIKDGVRMADNARGYADYNENNVEGIHANNDFWGTRSTFNLKSDNTEVQNVLLNEVVMYSPGSNTKVNNDMYAYRFWNASKDNWTANKMYGIHLDNITNGTTANYGLYMGNVGGTTSSTENYAIYTNAGDVRIGDLAGTGSLSTDTTDKIVVADTDGVLKTKDASQLVAEAGEWVTGDINSSTLTYMKEAMKQGDTIAYRKSGYYLNLGQGDAKKNIWSDGITLATPVGEIPYLNIISSKALPVNSTVGDAKNIFHLSQNLFIVEDNHVGSASTATALKSYLGSDSKLLVSKDVNNDLAAATGSVLSLINHSAKNVGAIYGGRTFVANGIAGETSGTTGSVLSLFSEAKNYATTKYLIGNETRVKNYGNAEIIYGLSIKSNTQEAENGTTAAHTVKTIRGIHSNVNVAENATISTNSVYGIENTVTAQATSSTQNILGGINRINIKDGVRMADNARGYADYNENNVEGIHANNDFWGTRSVFNLKSDNTEVRDVLLNEVVMYSKGSNTKVNNDMYAYRFWNASKDNWTANKMYGIHLDNITNGTTANYGLYMGNVGGTTSSTENYAIYTNAGDVRIGDLAGTGNRMVVADANGVLKAGTATVAQATSKWTDDATNKVVKLTNLSDGTTARTEDKNIFVSDNGKMGVGTATPTESLEVAGNVKAISFIAANMKTFPDYVFETYYNGTSELNNDYGFMSLEEVEAFTKANNHLPGYESARAVAEKGSLDLGATQLKNVEKIEELYLHTIEQGKKIESQNTRIEVQQQQIEELKSLVQQLLEKK